MPPKNHKKFKRIMSSKKTWPSIVLIFGIVISIVGAILIIGYILEAYVARRGDPDQSLLFWYLPLLFVGFISFTTGLSASIWGFNSLRKINMKKPFSTILSLLLNNHYCCSIKYPCYDRIITILVVV